jgi:hypothetical protein
MITAIKALVIATKAPEIITAIKEANLLTMIAAIKEPNLLTMIAAIKG